MVIKFGQVSPLFSSSPQLTGFATKIESVPQGFKGRQKLTRYARLDTFDAPLLKPLRSFLSMQNRRSLRGGGQRKNLVFLSKIDNHV